MDSDDYISLVLYYGREHFYHSMQKSSLDGLAKYPMQSAFRLFNGISLALGNRVQEGIRELNPLKNDSDLGLAAILSLIYAHNQCSIIDKDMLQLLEQRLCDEKDSASSIGNYYAAVFLYLTGSIDRARKYADKAIKISKQLDSAIILKAWCELSGGGHLSGNILQDFEDVLSRSNGKHIDATLGIVRFHQLRGQYELAIMVLNKLSVRFPNLNIPLIEKMYTQLVALDWDHALETAMRIVNLESSNVAGLRIKGLLLIGYESNFKAAAATLQQLLNSVERMEIGNFNLIMEVCQLYSRICSRNKDILLVTVKYMSKINLLSPGNASYVTELGYQQLMLCNIKEAEACFRSATKVNNNYFNALCGLTICLLNQGSEVYAEARQHLEFLKELCGNRQESILFYISAKLSVESDAAIQLLIEALEQHLKKLEFQAFNINYICQLNPDYLLQLASEFLKHSPIQMRLNLGIHQASNSIHITLKQCITILETIIHICPSHIQALYMRSKVDFLCGEELNAIQRLQRILNDIDETYTDAYLLISQIELQQNHLQNAQQNLELALSHNFAIRDKPIYHLLMGIIQHRKHQLNEAKQSFLTAMQIIGADQTRELEQHIHSIISVERSVNSFTLSDEVTLYLELISTLREMGDTQSIYESERLLQCAIEEFGTTTEAGRLIIAQAELMLQNLNVSRAISLLASIQLGQSYYIQAKTQLANIYLQHRKDRVSFSRCFKELVEAQPVSESYLMLGDSYMSIQEPDLAVGAYQKALALNPQDSLLSSKLGRAYVKTHQYTKALKFYHDVLQNPDHSCLRLDLAELYLKLKRYKNAAETLIDDVHQNKINDENIMELQLRTKKLLLLARIYEKSGNISQSLQILREARDNQYRMQKRCSVDQSENSQEQLKILSKICLLMAQQFINIRDNDQALQYFKECVKYTPNDIEILAALARLYMQMNSMDLCYDICMQILQIDSNNEAASVMMADLSFRKIEFDNAAFHFSQLLMSQPCYWTALARFIEVMRRSGTLPEAVSFLQRAEQQILNSTQSSDFNYCKGLYEWYNGNPNGALRHFNIARRDPEWGQQAIFNMIEICINPDGEVPNANDAQDATDTGECNDSRSIALRTAERLLKELHPRSGGMNNEALNHRLLHNFLQISTKRKFQIETALHDFTELAQKEEYQNLVGPVLGIASALVLLKQVQRAKNHLKRIARIPWNFEEAEYLERCWLLLADIYVQANKAEVAESFVDRVLEYNKSSAKAYELAGHIAEKEQSYRNAAKNYLNAWNFGGRSKPHIGYKLAYCYMKSKQYANAVDVCHQVINTHPDYIVIHKDVLNRCRNNLRP